jgi:dTDP-4-dehydrorhamnose 3,5-epimerase
VKFHPTSLPGVTLIHANCFEDQRGLFIKPFHSRAFLAHGMSFEPKEEFFSVSKVGVIRGMHFQVPPSDQWKLVFCISGRILDAVLDLRRAEPTFGHHLALELSAKNSFCLLIPPGLAHGFCALEEGSIVYYSATTVYDPAADCGVRWDSFGMRWPVTEPIVSTRDSELPALADFDSPF